MISYFCDLFQYFLYVGMYTSKYIKITLKENKVFNFSL